MNQTPQAMTDGQIVADLISKKWNQPMPVVSGTPAKPAEGVAARPSVGDDEQLLAKTSHVRKPNERMMEFYARTGLGPAQILSYSRDEIARFVETVSSPTHPMAPSNSLAPQQRRLPNKFVL